jgi:hypothetical protein
VAQACAPGCSREAVASRASLNRWQRGAIVDAVYLGDAAETVWAEWYRHLAEAGIPPAARLPGRDLELEGRPTCETGITELVREPD